MLDLLLCSFVFSVFTSIQPNMFVLKIFRDLIAVHTLADDQFSCCCSCIKRVKILHNPTFSQISRCCCRIWVINDKNEYECM